jgi:hypothetical protein
MKWLTWLAQLFGARPPAPRKPELPRPIPAWEPLVPEDDDDVTRLNRPGQRPEVSAPPALLDAVFEPEPDTAVNTKVVLAGTPATGATDPISLSMWRTASLAPP